MKRITMLTLPWLVPALFVSAPSVLADPPRGDVIATHVFTVADDFVVDVYHNGVKVPDAKRTLVKEVYGASSERIDVAVRKGDWLVFHVVNNRFRWNGASYFGVTARGERGVAFTTELESKKWSYCDDPSLVDRFVLARDSGTDQKAVRIEKPWGEGDSIMKEIADGWNGTPVWGKASSTWIKYVAR